MKAPQHKLCLVFLSVILLFYSAVAQSYDVTGIWSGGLSQDDKTWVFQMNLSLKQVQNTISGTAKYTANDGSGAFVLFDLTGEVSGNKIYFNDVTVREENNLSGRWYWCKKMAYGMISIENDSLILSGDWKNEGKKIFHNKKILVNSRVYCYPGTFRVAKYYENQDDAKNGTKQVQHENAILKSESSKTSNRVFLNRKIDIKHQFEVNSDSVKLTFYDNGQIDNDTISVYYNQLLIINRQKLSSKPIEITVAILPGKDNELLMFADNLGSIPPNTALLVFTDNGQRREITIDSNTKASGTIVIRRRN